MHLKNQFQFLIKYLYIAIFVITISPRLNAQLCVGASVGTNISNLSTLGISIPEPAFDIASSYQISKHFTLGANVGMYPFINQFRGYSWIIIPVQITGGYIIGDSRDNLYSFIKVAYGLYSNIDSKETSLDMGIAPQFGFHYLLSKKLCFEGGLKYNIIIPTENDSSFKFLGCSVGLVYNINKSKR